MPPPGPTPLLLIRGTGQQAIFLAGRPGRRRQPRAGEDAIGRAEPLAGAARLAAVEGRQTLADLLGDRRLARQEQLGIQDDPRRPAGDARRRRVRADAALHEDRQVGISPPLDMGPPPLQEDERRLGADPSTGFVPFEDQAVHPKAFAKLCLGQAHRLEQDPAAPTLQALDAPFQVRVLSPGQADPVQTIRGECRQEGIQEGGAFRADLDSERPRGIELQPAQLFPCLLLGRVLDVQVTLCPRPARGDSKGGVYPCGGR